MAVNANVKNCDIETGYNYSNALNLLIGWTIETLTR